MKDWNGLSNMSCIKMSKRCQIVKKISNVKKPNSWTREEVHKEITRHNEVHIWWCKFGCHMWKSSKFYFMNISRIFDDHHTWHQNWPYYVWSPLCQSFLRMSSIVKQFNFLIYDIFMIIWLKSDFFHLVVNAFIEFSEHRSIH